MEKAVMIFTYVLTLGFLGIFLVLIWKMITNKIDLDELISEPDGKASMSRFQLFLFTVVIAGLYVILSIESGQLLDVPAGALGLLGISGGSFVVSKAVGAAAENDAKKKKKPARNTV